MARKRRTRLEMLGLMKTTLPADTHAVIIRRVKPFRSLHLERTNIFALPGAIERFGTDCYLQGLIDGAGVATRHPEGFGEMFTTDGENLLAKVTDHDGQER